MKLNNTSKKKIKKAKLQTEAERAFSLLLLNTEEPFILVDPDLIVVSFNQQFKDQYQKFFGIKLEKGISILNYAQTTTVDALKKIYEQALQGLSYQTEFDFLFEDDKKTFLLKYKPALDANKQTIGVFVSSTEITEIKKSQDLLVSNEKRYRALVENAGDAMIILGIDGKVNYVSPSIKKVLGYSEEEGMALDVFKTVHPDEVAETTKVMQKVLESPGQTIQGYTGRVLHKDGSWRWCDAYLTNMLHDPHIHGIVNNFRDVTERIEAEKKLKQAESRFRTLIEHNYDGIVLRDKNLTITYGSSSSERILGWTLEDKLGKDFSDKTHPEDLEKVKENETAVLQNPGIPYPLIFRTKHKAGHYVWVERVMTNMLHDESINAIVANFRDVTDKMEAEQKRIFDHNNLHALINNTHDLVWSVSAEGKIITSNRAFNEMVLAHSGHPVIEGESPLNGFPEDQLARWKRLYERALADEIFTVIEYTNFGQERWAEISFYPIHQNHKIIGTACYSRDITERKLSEQKILQNTAELLKIKKELEYKESRLNQAQAIAHVGNWEMNLTTKISTLSDEAYRICGFEPGDPKLTTNLWKMLIHPEDLPSFEIELMKAEQAFGNVSYKHRIMRPDRTIRYAVSESRYELDGNGTPIGLYGVVHDITEQKESEEKLRKQDSLFRAIIEKGSEMKTLINPDGKIIFGTPSITRILGYTQEEYLGMNERELVHPEDAEELFRNIKLSITGEQFFENMQLRIKTKLGDYRWCEKTITNLLDDPDVNAIVCNFWDITDKKKADLLLKENKDRYDLVAKATSDAIWDYNFSNNTTYIAGSGYKQLFGYDIVNDYTENFFWEERLHPEDKTRIINELKNFIEDITQTQCQYEYRFKKADGSYAYVNDRFFIIREDDIPVRIIGAVNDITKQKAEEHHLKLLESIITNTKDAVMITEAEKIAGSGHKIIYVNNALTQMSGYSKEEMLGQTPRMFQGPKSDREQLFKLKKAIENKESCNAELINYNKNGRMYWVDLGIAPVTDTTNKVSHFIAIERDITSRKIQEQEREKLIFELLQNNKDLRQFSYITSHNLRGPIANLLGLTNLLENYTIEDPTLLKILAGIQKATLNFDETIKDLSSILNIKDRPSIPREEIQFSTIHEKIVNQYASTINETNTIIKIDFSEAPFVSFNKAYLESIYSNLLTNGIKYKKRLVPVEITITSESNDNEVILKFEDTGRGIDLEEHKDRLFGLYQRFHLNTEGKGLGLFLVKSQLEALNGSIEVESKIDQGTIFILRFKK